MPSAHRRGDDVGQVELALRVVRRERGDPARAAARSARPCTPVLISWIARCASLASRSSTIACTRPAASRTMRPSPAGSGTFAVSTARWPASASRTSAASASGGHERDVADRHERHAVAGQRIAARRGPRRRCRAADPAARTRGRARPASRARLARRGRRRPRSRAARASAPRRSRTRRGAGRPADAAPWAAPSASACLGRRRGRRR